ncbi:MAG TPA: hypothetical protein VFA70_14140 [Dehalococcoidia bacterium]|nr:hypothetical protein [Dehalococcoidia bacterium]
MLLALALAALAGSAPGRARAQSAPPPGYTVMPAGWNLISTATATALNLPSAAPTLYTLQPGDTAYQSVHWNALHTGFGYWALFTENTAVRLPPSNVDSYAVDVPAGSWVMVGNPSTSASARISGADAAFVYSPLSGYRDDTLVPVGYGAFVYSASGGRVTVAVQDADRTQADFASCCTIGPGQYGGMAHIDILDDSPYALFFGVRALDAAGNFLPPVAGDYAYGVVQACAVCTEYAAPPPSCRSLATTRTVDVRPGTYLIRLTTDGPLVPDIILTVPLAADTHYYLCRWVAAGRR